MKKFSLVAAVTALVLLVAGSPAGASGGSNSTPATVAAAGPVGPQPGPGPKTGTVKIPVKGVDGAATEVIVCIEYTAPEPTYSGINKYIHWGMGISCSEDGPFEMSFEGWLYIVTGSGDHETRWQQDHFGPRFGVYLRTQTSGKNTPCVGSASTRWVARIKGTVDGTNMTPEYAWSDVWTFPCD